MGNKAEPFDEGESAGETCALCGRPFGRQKQRHHLIPRLKGGKETVDLHPICHRKIHSLFTEAELARHYSTIEALQAHPEIAKFINWVKNRPPDFHSKTIRKKR
ncbi:MAG: HNH endonuclease [Alphaproteobacteria bacterium]|nr:HNH endonuclease [Alphaproteobacteria bacterium]